MKNSKFKVGVAVFSILATTAIIAGTAQAHNKDFQEKTTETKENLMEVRDLVREGRYEEAGSLRGEMMHGNRNEHGMNGKKDRKHYFSDEKRDSIKEAMKNNDYSAWVSAVGENSKMAKEVTKDEFPKLVKSYNLMKEAKELRESIGLDFKHKNFR